MQALTCQQSLKYVERSMISWFRLLKLYPKWQLDNQIYFITLKKKSS